MGLFNEVQRALDTARAADYAVNEHTKEMVRLVQGRLRKAYSGSATYQEMQALKALKRELRDFDMTTGRWKDRP